MATENQKLGEFGEKAVAAKCNCPRCKREKTLKKLPTNFKCADLICDFCGFLAQVKSSKVKDPDILPNSVLGAAWKPQKERMDAGIYFPLYLVLCGAEKHRIYYLSADLQSPQMFVPRKPLGPDAKRSGWQGFYYDLSAISENSLVKLF